jgi:hypothetical protein
MEQRKPESSPRHKGYPSFLALLRDLTEDDIHHLAEKTHWLHKGWPRTTNSAESVHGHLNAQTDGHREAVIERMEAVAKRLVAHYENSNQSCDPPRTLRTVRGFIGLGWNSVVRFITSPTRPSMPPASAGDHDPIHKPSQSFISPDSIQARSNAPQNRCLSVFSEGGRPLVAQHGIGEAINGRRYIMR